MLLVCVLGGGLERTVTSIPHFYAHEDTGALPEGVRRMRLLARDSDADHAPGEPPPALPPPSSLSSSSPFILLRLLPDLHVVADGLSVVLLFPIDLLCLVLLPPVFLPSAVAWSCKGRNSKDRSVFTKHVCMAYSIVCASSTDKLYFGVLLHPAAPV